MNTIKLVIDKSGIFKKIDQKVEALCYALLWSSMFVCMAQIAYI
jgi:hypothetical protein